MSFALSRNGRLVAWTVLYGGAVWLMISKSEESFATLIWGLAFGVGAAMALCKVAVPTWQRRLGVIVLWFLGCWLLGLAFFWGEREVFGPESGTLAERLQNSLLVTLLPAFPALLALVVWLFRRPQPRVQAAPTN